MQTHGLKSFVRYAVNIIFKLLLTWLFQGLINHKYRALFASPEMLLEHYGFSALIRTPSFTEDIMCISSKSPDICFTMSAVDSARLVPGVLECLGTRLGILTRTLQRRGLNMCILCPRDAAESKSEAEILRNCAYSRG